MKYIYYSNPRCSKCKSGLKAIIEKGLDFTIKEYLKEKLTVDELQTIFKKLNLSPNEAIRKNESPFQDIDLSNKELSVEDWCKVIIENPILLQRPILVGPTKARIGRPTENLFDAI